LSQYLTLNRKVTIKIKGYTDASKINGTITYKGEYGDFYNEPFFFNSDITTVSFIKNSKFNSNRDLGYLRTLGVRNFIDHQIDILKKCNVVYEHEVIVDDRVGSNFRKISVEVIIEDAYNTHTNETNRSKTNIAGINYEDLYLKCKKSVFMIELESLMGTSQGSGFIISSDGIAVSNYHVFADGFWKTARIHLDNGEIAVIEKIIEQDPDKDFIVFKLKKAGNSDFPKLKISTSLPKVAAPVFTIGNPQALEKSFSKGEISSYRFKYQFLQTTTPISHGSSGGPLMNSDGEVVGITQGTFKEMSKVYDSNGNIIGFTENGGQGNLYRAINILPLNLLKYVK